MITTIWEAKIRVSLSSESINNINMVSKSRKNTLKAARVGHKYSMVLVFR